MMPLEFFAANRSSHGTSHGTTRYKTPPTELPEEKEIHIGFTVERAVRICPGAAHLTY